MVIPAQVSSIEILRERVEEMSPFKKGEGKGGSDPKVSVVNHN